MKKAILLISSILLPVVCLFLSCNFQGSAVNDKNKEVIEDGEIAPNPTRNHADGD